MHAGRRIGRLGSGREGKVSEDGVIVREGQKPGGCSRICQLGGIRLAGLIYQSQCAIES